MKTKLILASALPIMISGSPALAGNGTYTGSWQAALTKDAHGFNNTYCLTLTDDGSAGFKHSGYLVMTSNPYGGTFQVVRGRILIFVGTPGGNASIATLVFTVGAANGQIDKHGTFDGVEGQPYDWAEATFVPESSC